VTLCGTTMTGDHPQSPVSWAVRFFRQPHKILVFGSKCRPQWSDNVIFNVTYVDPKPRNYRRYRLAWPRKRRHSKGSHGWSANYGYWTCSGPLWPFTPLPLALWHTSSVYVCTCCIFAYIRTECMLLRNVTVHGMGSHQRKRARQWSAWWVVASHHL
jgi:hypothetical protein